MITNKKKNIFTTELRRKGKFTEVGKFESFSKALEFGKLKARKTLGASLRVKENGKLIPLAPQQEFRKSKSNDIFSLIQTAPTRLTSQQERAEIKQARGVLSLQ